MFRSVLLGTIALLASVSLAADAGSKDAVKNAAKQLGEKGNYSWKTATATPGGAAAAGRMQVGPTEGKTDKDGTILLAVTRGDATIDAVIKGDKGAVKTADGWKSLAEAADAAGGGGQGQGNPAGFMARMLRTYKAPAVEAADLADKAKDLAKADDAIAGDLTEEGAKALLAFRRGGANAPAPEVQGAKGTVKFWIKDGVLFKYEYNVQGKMTFNNTDRDINRTTTVEIKDIGSTKLDVPDDAKKKIG
jgi:hypothetical protein